MLTTSTDSKDTEDVTGFWEVIIIIPKSPSPWLNLNLWESSCSRESGPWPASVPASPKTSGFALVFWRFTILQHNADLVVMMCLKSFVMCFVILILTIALEMCSNWTCKLIQIHTPWSPPHFQGSQMPCLNHTHTPYTHFSPFSLNSHSTHSLAT